MKEIEAKVSIIKYIHSIFITFKGGSFKIIKPPTIIILVTMLTTIKNCTNFFILSKIFLPYFNSSTKFSNLSSKSIKPASDLTDCDEWFSIAIPTSANFMDCVAKESTSEQDLEFSIKKGNCY